MKTRAHSLAWDTNSPEATIRFGETLGRVLMGGWVIGLVGPLGAGKTQLVKGIASGNAVDDLRRVTSPTFTLIQEYPGRLTLYHLDAYRLPNVKAFLDLGFEELIRSDSAVIVEWADRVASVLPAETLWIEIASTGESRRAMTLRSAHPSLIDRLEALGRGQT